MGKIAFLFSGQGDQHPGMGRELFDRYEAAARVFQALEAIRPGTMAQCFSGTPEELKQTRNTQPCLFAMELAGAETLARLGIMPDAVAGFSLGEVTAAAFSGVFNGETGFRLVCRRGELMDAAAREQDTAMAAVLKLSEERVVSLCQARPDIYPVNFNCPGNITVSGLAEQMPGFCADVKAAGGRALPLKVQGGFHSPFMAEAAEAFEAELAAQELHAPRVRLYSNVTAEVYDSDPARLLARQIASPVRWERLIRNMIDAGIDTFIEIGPGRTLTNMVKKIHPGVRAITITECLEETQC